MTDVVLPRLSQTGKAEWSDVESNDVAIREVLNGELDNNNLSGAAGITRANLAAESKPVKWYTPKNIATEQSRESTEFGTLTTADEIKEVVLPENGLIRIRYVAIWKSSVNSAGRVTIYLNSTQVSDANGGTEGIATQTAGEFRTLATYGGTLATGSQTSYPTAAFAASPLDVTAPAGTYTVTVKYRAISGTVTAKERKLSVEVLGT